MKHLLFVLTFLLAPFSAIADGGAAPPVYIYWFSSEQDNFDMSMIAKAVAAEVRRAPLATKVFIVGPSGDFTTHEIVNRNLASKAVQGLIEHMAPPKHPAHRRTPDFRAMIRRDVYPANRITVFGEKPDALPGLPETQVRHYSVEFLQSHVFDGKTWQRYDSQGE